MRAAFGIARPSQSLPNARAYRAALLRWPNWFLGLRVNIGIAPGLLRKLKLSSDAPMSRFTSRYRIYWVEPTVLAHGNNAVSGW